MLLGEMAMANSKLLYEDLTYKIIGLAMEIHNELGYGFLEKVYENSLMVLLNQVEVPAVQQAIIPVYFREEIVGNYCADILVDEKVILELKAVDQVIDAHRAQVLNYLKATKAPVAIILNFGKPKLTFERFVL